MTNSSAPGAWQALCTTELVDSVDLGGAEGRDKWEAFRAQHPDTEKRILVADADFEGKDLRGYDLSRCWIGRTSFVDADLREASFAQSIFRKCAATNANIEGAKFRDADMLGDGLALQTKRYDDTTDFEVGLDRLPDNLDPGLRDAALRARGKRLWRFRKSRSKVVRALLWLTDYGFSLHRLIWAGAAVVVGFGLLFWKAGNTASDSALASIAYFLSLNDRFTDLPSMALMGSVEALAGMLFFAVLTTVLVTMYFDKN